VENFNYPTQIMMIWILNSTVELSKMCNLNRFDLSIKCILSFIRIFFVLCTMKKREKLFITMFILNA
jgi:hypothetical protein